MLLDVLLLLPLLSRCTVCEIIWYVEHTTCRLMCCAASSPGHENTYSARMSTARVKDNGDRRQSTSSEGTENQPTRGRALLS